MENKPEQHEIVQLCLKINFHSRKPGQHLQVRHCCLPESILMITFPIICWSYLEMNLHSVQLGHELQLQDLAKCTFKLHPHDCINLTADYGTELTILLGLCF